MTDRLPSLTPREVMRVLEHAGFEFRRQSGSHAQFRHRDDHARRATVPVHTGTLKRGTLAGILKQAGLSQEEFLRFLTE